jgi:transposase-like protein
MRWTAKRKAEIVAQIKAGTLSIETARREFLLSEEELAAWMRDLDTYGLRGLRTLKVQVYARRRRARAVGGMAASAGISEAAKPR